MRRADDLVFWSVLSLFLFLFPWPEALRADDEAGTAVEELFLGELVFPQEKGELQWGVGAELGAERALWSLVEWGWTDALQLELELEGAVDDDASGLDSVELGLRYTSLDVRPGMHVAFGAALAWAPRDGEAPRDSLVLEPSVILGRDLADGRAHVYTQLGAEWVLDEGDSSSFLSELEDEWVWTLGGYRATPWGVATLELQGARDFEGDEDAAWHGALGWVFKLGAGELGLARTVRIDGDHEEAWLIHWVVELDGD